MTVKDLIEYLKWQPENAEVYVATKCHGCFEPVATVYHDSRGMVVVEGGEDR